MVRSVTFEIRWHDMQPIYSCSFQPIPSAQLHRVLDFNQSQAAGIEPNKVLAASSNDGSKASTSRQTAIPLNSRGQSWRFATAGGDNHARIWLVHPNIPSPAALAAAVTGSGSTPSPSPPRVEYRATLKRHSGVVNCARFCPKGELLATTGDDGMVLLWIPSDAPSSSFGPAIDDDGDAEFAKEHWRLRTMSRASSSETYDMAWSPSGDALVIGGTDFVARIINANDGTVLREISEHNHYIQGVAWDPLAEYIATQSSDRSVHVHHLHSKQYSGDYGSVQTVGRNTRMDVHHRRGGSGNGHGHFVWDPNAKPPMKRRASSHASHASDSEREGPPPSRSNGNSMGKRTGRSSTPLDIPANNGSMPTQHNSAGLSATSSVFPRAGTPTLSQQSPALNSMNPPQRTPSRRSSFSGSQIEALSPPTSATSFVPGSSHPASIATPNTSTAAISGGSAIAHSKSSVAGDMLPTSSTSRSASRQRGITPRSPSPAPPLPAIRAPPSPKQRMAVAAMQSQNTMAGVGTLARAGMRLYGDENFSGFFRRLTFSPDGALLVTPTGIFESSNVAAFNQMHATPASPTVTAQTIANRRMSENEEGASPMLSSHHLASPLPHHSGNANAAATTTAAAAVPRSTVYLYGRANLHKSNAPIAHLPGHKTASLVIKFSPILYELRKGTKWNRSDDTEGIAPHPNVPLEVGKQKTVSLASAASAAGGFASSSAVQDDSTNTSHDSNPKLSRSYSSTSSSANSSPQKYTSTTSPIPSSSSTAMIGLPYRMIFAVATHDSVWIYDTQQGGPLCCFSNMHYASFTDLTWSSDGQTLMMCSTDGYCSVVVFDYGELGVPYQYQSQPSLQSASTTSHSNASSTATSAPMTAVKSAPHLESPLLVRRGSGHANVALQSQAQEGGAKSNPSPPLGLGLATNSAEGDIASTTNNQEDVNPSAKKKRRIAPTLQGPIGS